METALALITGAVDYAPVQASAGTIGAAVAGVLILMAGIAYVLGMIRKR